MCTTLQNSQPMKPFELQAAEFHHRGAASDGRQFAEVEVAERRGSGPAGDARRDQLGRHSAPICFAAGAMPGTGRPAASRTRGGVADDENVRMPGQR